MSKLEQVTFTFDSFWVRFVGSMVVVCLDENSPLEAENRWVATKREDDGVMGRAFKPRVTDALVLAKIAREGQWEERMLREPVAADD